MTTRQLTTLNLDTFTRNAIGVREFMNSVQDRIEHANTGNYPPYNIIELSEDAYRLEMAIAGFSKDDVTITVENSQLEIAGDSTRKSADELGGGYLHHGIGSRAFERRFALADHVEVTSASVTDGILTVDLARVVPEELKPKTIEIK